MKKLNKLFFNVIFIIVVGVLVIIATLSSNFKDVVNTLVNIRVSWLLLAIFITFLWQFLIGLILTVLTRFLHKDYKIRDGFINALVASFFHGITPSASGGQFAQTYVFRKQGVSSAVSICVLWLDFVLYQSVLCFTTLLLIVVKFNYFKETYENWFSLIIIGFLVNFLVIFGLFAIAKFEKLHRWISYKGLVLANKFRLVKDVDKARESFEQKISHFQDQSRKLSGNWKIVSYILLLNVLRLFCYYVVPFFIFISLGQKVNLDIFITSLAITAFVSMLSAFIPLPGGALGSESLFILMFGHLFNLSVVQSNMILWRFITYYLLMIVGSITFMYVQLKED